MDQQDKANNEPIPCSKGCGFFGRASTDGMCSKCYKEHIGTISGAAKSVSSSSISTPSIMTLEQNKKIKMEVRVEAEQQLQTEPLSTSSETATAVSSSFVSSHHIDKTRCAECKKKVGLTGIECRCGKVYCGSHRQAEKHACTFDFKEFGRRNIEKANERVVAQSLVDKL